MKIRSQPLFHPVPTQVLKILPNLPLIFSRTAYSETTGFSGTKSLQILIPSLFHPLPSPVHVRLPPLRHRPLKQGTADLHKVPLHRGREDRSKAVRRQGTQDLNRTVPPPETAERFRVPTEQNTAPVPHHLKPKEPQGRHLRLNVGSIPFLGTQYLPQPQQWKSPTAGSTVLLLS